MDKGFMRAHGLTTRKVTYPIPVYNIDGTPNEAGAIQEVVDVILRYEGHSERMALAVTQLRKEQVILGYPWLQDHNPEIDWCMQKIKLMRCIPHCHYCKARAQGIRMDPLLQNGGSTPVDRRRGKDR
jgi:hypothetical protein